MRTIPLSLSLPERFPVWNFIISNVLFMTTLLRCRTGEFKLENSNVTVDGGVRSLSGCSAQPIIFLFNFDDLITERNSHIEPNINIVVPRLEIRRVKKKKNFSHCSSGLPLVLVWKLIADRSVNHIFSGLLKISTLFKRQTEDEPAPTGRGWETKRAKCFPFPFRRTQLVEFPWKAISLGSRFWAINVFFRRRKVSIDESFHWPVWSESAVQDLLIKAQVVLR